MKLHETFELYLDDGEAPPRFEALTCLPSELVGHVREMLKAKRLKAIEVRQGGETLFTLH